MSCFTVDEGLASEEACVSSTEAHPWRLSVLAGRVLPGVLLARVLC